MKILVFTIAVILRHGQARQRHAHTRSRRLVHLAVYQGSLVNNAALFHFVVQVVALAGTLANAGEDGQAAVLLGHVINQLHDQYRFANAGAAEQADLAALGVGANQVYHLDARFQDFCGGFLLLIRRGRTVDRPALHIFRIGLIVDGLTQQVKNAAQALIAHGHGDGAAGIHGVQPAHHTVGGVHGNAAGHVIADMLRHFGHDLAVAALDFDGVEQLGQLTVLKTDVQHRADNLNHFANVLFAHDGLFLLSRCVILPRQPQFR